MGPGRAEGGINIIILPERIIVQPHFILENMGREPVCTNKVAQLFCGILGDVNVAQQLLAEGVGEGLFPYFGAKMSTIRLGCATCCSKERSTIRQKFPGRRVLAQDTLLKFSPCRGKGTY